MPDQPRLTLYNHPVSSYAQKARVVLREKGVDFELVSPLNIQGGQPDPAFLKANPRGEVPVLAVAGDSHCATPDFHVVDSRVICEYLEERFPQNALLPKDPAARAKAREIEQVMDCQFEGINWAWGEVQWMRRADAHPGLEEHIRKEVVRQTDVVKAWLEERLEPSGWLAGGSFSLADVAAACILHRSRHFGFGPAPGSKLSSWLDRVEQRPAVKTTFQEFDDNVHAMGGLAETFLSGRRKREFRDYRLEFLVKSGGMPIVLEGLKNNNIRFPWPEGEQSG